MGRVRALRRRWTGTPVLLRDAALAAVLTVAGQAELLVLADDVEGPRALQHLAFAVMTGSLVWRRAAPLVAPAVCGGGLAFQTVLGPAPAASGYIALFVLVYSVATYARSRRDAVLGLLAVLAGIAVYPFVGDDVRLADEVVNAMIPTVVWALARVARERLDRAVAAERLRQQQAHEEERRRDDALAAERRRIARELHDTVAHGVTLMVVQAEVAAGTDGVDTDVRDALGIVQRSGRTCLHDLRRLLVLLRHEPSCSPDLALADLPVLVEASCGAGITVRLSPAEPAPALSREVEAVAYRIVQEALTNAVRYAPGAVVDVCWRCVDGSLEVQVRDDGPRTAPIPRQGSGTGLRGARERVEALGGALTAGPRKDGAGWHVLAVLPLRVAVTS